ncbi:MAG: alpha/beta hydrolase [Pseudomonadota bacterium]|nr:alpha/beta hydrolase [Pseudomonadota bacterium]
MQQNRAPRPLPLFLELVRRVSETDPELAAKALDGLARYEQAPRIRTTPKRTSIGSAGSATLRDCGGRGAPVVLVPSLINPPGILDLDPDVSLAAAIARMDRHALLLEWGPAAGRRDLDLGGHIQELLLPLLRQLDAKPALVGYCLGGTMAVAAANLIPVERVATLAAPWSFSAYPADARESLAQLWESARSAAQMFGMLPMEVLQGAFWSLDPRRTVTKFARFAELEPGSPQALRFVTLEDWANEGEALPFPAARELMEDLFDADLPGCSEWRVSGNRIDADLDCPLLNITSASDRITPAATAPAGETVQVPSGHVGMVVGSARAGLHDLLAQFLSAPCR